MGLGRELGLGLGLGYPPPGISPLDLPQISPRSPLGLGLLAAAPCVDEEDAPHHREEGKVRHLAWGRVRARHLAGLGIGARARARARG